MPEFFGKFECQYSYKLYLSFYQEKLSFLSQTQKSYFNNVNRYKFQKQLLDVFSTNSCFWK